MDNEFILFDRLEVIRKTVQEYGEENFYLSFSGGRDSTVVHHLLDMAIPNNEIPRVFMNTGIEYNAIVKFVQHLAEKDERFVMLKPQKPIKKTLDEKGYPFKSKGYSQWYSYSRYHKDEFHQLQKQIDENPTLLENYDFIHSLPYGTKWVVKGFYGIRERNGELYQFDRIPEVLKYQMSDDFNLNISDMCCEEMKEQPLNRWAKDNHKPNYLTGMSRAEGGRRSRINCLLVKKNKVAFHPLAKVSNEWIDWFIEKYNIQLCELYSEPFNFERTGCKGCPFAINLQEQLETMEKYMPNERKQCEILWKPVYDEYRRLGYRLKKDEQLKLF